MLPNLVFQSRHHIAWRAGRYDEGTHAFFACAFVGDSQHNGHIAIFATGDELFHTIEHVCIAFARGRCSDGRCIRAHVRFSQTKQAQQLALRQTREPFLLLRVVAVAHEDGVDWTVGDADGGAHTAIACRNFF